jgi:anti-sigma B factor antagonist
VNPSRSETLEIEVVEESGSPRILKLAGPLTLQTLFDFQTTARGETSKPVIIDITNVAYMDSAGLGSVIGVYTSCERTGRGFAIVGLSDRIRVLFEVTHVDNILPCFGSLEAAKAAITSQS